MLEKETVTLAVYREHFWFFAVFFWFDGKEVDHVGLLLPKENKPRAVLSKGTASDGKCATEVYDEEKTTFVFELFQDFKSFWG